MREGQNFSVRRGQHLTLRFTVAGGAGATAAHWYVGASFAAAARDLARTSDPGGGVTLADQGADLVVEVELTPTETEALPVGRRDHQLWVLDGTGRWVADAEGKADVRDSLKTV